MNLTDKTQTTHAAPIASARALRDERMANVLAWRTAKGLPATSGRVRFGTMAAALGRAGVEASSPATAVA